MNALADIARLAERGDIVMRQASPPLFDIMHAVPKGYTTALCGLVPSGYWLDIDDQDARLRTCRACHFQLQRAGYSVSFSGRITRVEQAS
jgi:hypothetical protein